uniref:Uncharacterized protein n=1 Tax=Oryza meridionalis TaxID=40149 RepID=A0A0E0F3E8_9ORYZ
MAVAGPPRSEARGRGGSPGQRRWRRRTREGEGCVEGGEQDGSVGSDNLDVISCGDMGSSVGDDDDKESSMGTPASAN